MFMECLQDWWSMPTVIWNCLDVGDKYDVGAFAST